MKSEKNEDNLNLLGLSVANHVSAMLAYWDKNLVCRFANAAYMAWFGKSREEMIDKITIQELLGPLYEKNLSYISGALEGNVQTFEREITVPTGGVRHSIANYFPDIVDGEVKGFFAHVADITPIKLLEKELMRSNEIINDQNKRLLNFTNIVSHNLKTYANNLEAMLDLCITADSEEERDEMQNYLKLISKGFSSTIKHLNELLEVQNLKEIKSEEINLHNFINEVIEILRIQIKSANATILNNVGSEIILMANAAYMESILLNFLTNAIKYKDPNRDPLIELNTFFKDDELVLRIKDNGLGIDLEKHRKDLFGMYKTFHQNADAQGIGLFITKFQAESMGGRIEVESEVNKGSIFSIYFKV